MTTQIVDVVVVGGGPNGLVAANALGDAGWDVLLVEASDEVGGAVRSSEVTQPGFVTDLYSAFYPLAAASPVIRDLQLADHGLVWCRAPDVLAHALEDGRCAVLRSEATDTAAGLDDDASGDGDAWMGMFRDWQRLRDPLLDALFTPFPPVGPLARLLARLGTAGALELARLGVLPVRRLAQEQFRGDAAALLLTGNALHSDLSPDATCSGIFGWLLTMLGQDVGFPVPQGGAGRLALALRSRAEATGVQVRTGNEVMSIEVAHGRASGVVLADGSKVRVRRAVLADVSAPRLYNELLGTQHLPAAFVERLRRFQWDHSTLKVNWALDRPVPWAAVSAAGSGTVHLGVDIDGFVDFAADLTVGRVPQRPFLLFGQMTTADASRSPQGTESAWAYTHLPHRAEWSDDELSEHVERMENAVEKVAPGFRAAQVARYVQSPAQLERANRNLKGGAVNGGTSFAHQQLVFRPATGLGRPETPVQDLYLASASAHPGGGVHGACGWNAAVAALGAHGRIGAVRRALVGTAWARVLSGW
ncbi:MAG: phytoene desaturase family protein [Dermatophilaceae bacterium]